MVARDYSDADPDPNACGMVAMGSGPDPGIAALLVSFAWTKPAAGTTPRDLRSQRHCAGRAPGPDGCHGGDRDDRAGPDGNAHAGENPLGLQQSHGLADLHRVSVFASRYRLGIRNSDRVPVYPA